eukprot:gene3395-biopygen3446
MAPPGATGEPYPHPSGDHGSGTPWRQAPGVCVAQLLPPLPLHRRHGRLGLGPPLLVLPGGRQPVRRGNTEAPPALSYSRALHSGPGGAAGGKAQQACGRLRAPASAAAACGSVWNPSAVA